MFTYLAFLPYQTMFLHLCTLQLDHLILHILKHFSTVTIVVYKCVLAIKEGHNAENLQTLGFFTCFLQSLKVSFINLPINIDSHYIFQIISDGYAAHLNGLMDPGASRPATGNARMFLRKSCFRLPTQGESKKVAKRTISYPGPATKVNEFLRLPDTGPGPTKIIVPDIPVGDDECYGSASRARGKSPIVQKNIISKNTVV